MKLAGKEENYLSVAETAELLRTSKWLIHKLIKQGRLKATNLGKRKTIVRRSDIDKLFE